MRVPIPPLTEERRRDLAKKLSHIAEERRVGLRNVRRDANDALKKMTKEKLISEDEEKQAHEVIQKLTDAPDRQNRSGGESEGKGNFRVQVIRTSGILAFARLLTSAR